MSELSEVSPGTVSKILWHFTGGPRWNQKAKKQNTSPKPVKVAYENLKSILRTKELRLGEYKEIIKVLHPEKHTRNPKTREIEIQTNITEEIESSSVCCLADIPSPHLRYHANRYGRFAIGFHRKAVIQAGFNPVFYSLENTLIMRSIYEGLVSLRFADPSIISSAADDIQNDVESQMSDLESENADFDPDISLDLSTIHSEADALEDAISSGTQSLKDFVAFVKTFSEDEFSTIYCEREWRSTKAYKFKLDDVAMIVVPRVVGHTHYFDNFIKRFVSHAKIPRTIPILPWDDLVEH